MHTHNDNARLPRKSSKSAISFLGLCNVDVFFPNSALKLGQLKLIRREEGVVERGIESEIESWQQL